jgi:hypothetical protein
MVYHVHKVYQTLGSAVKWYPQGVGRPGYRAIRIPADVYRLLVAMAADRQLLLGEPVSVTAIAVELLRLGTGPNQTGRGQSG